MILIMGGFYDGYKGKNIKSIVMNSLLGKLGGIKEEDWDKSSVAKDLQTEYFRFNASNGYGERGNRITSVLIHKSLLEGG